MALSDHEGKLASPLTIIECQGDITDVEAITDIISQQQVKQIIVGLPRNMNGSMGEQAEKVIAFIEILCSHIEIPVEYRDERLTTVSAKRLMRAANNKKTKRTRHDDAIAAALILQGYLDEEH